MTAALGPGPLQRRAFRVLWLSGFLLYAGVWIQNVAAASLMAQLTPSPLMVALIPAATSLPVFLFGLAGGVLSDGLSPRRYVLATQACMFAASALLCASVLAGVLGPALLLAILFAFGAGGALHGPAWHASHMKAAGPDGVAAAVTLASIPYNVARIAGPALAGALIIGFGHGAVLALAVTALGAVMAILFITDPLGSDRGSGAQPFAAGLAEILRHARDNRACRSCLIGTAAFVSAASGLLALLPALARDQMDAGLGGYGGLVAGSGAGSIAGALLLPPLARRFGARAVATAAVAVCAVATASASHVASASASLVVVLFAGGAWIAVVNGDLGAMQRTVPDAMRARAVAVYLMAMQGATASGSALWGGVAERFGTSVALTASAAALLGALVLRRRLALKDGPPGRT